MFMTTSFSLPDEGNILAGRVTETGPLILEVAKTISC